MPRVIEKLRKTIYRKESILRLFLLALLFSVVLSGCAYYGDIHKHSHQLDSAKLAQHHIYPTTHPKAFRIAGWWNKFNDSQLNQLISVALQGSPSMKIAQARVHKARHMAEGAASTLWPSVDLSGYLQRQRFSETGLVPPPFNGQTFNIGDLGLNFNYEFDFWGKNRQTLKAKINETCAAEAELAQVQLVLSASVAQTYFQLNNNIAQLNVAQDKLQLNNKLFQIANNRKHRGIESAIPVKTIQANIQEAKQSVVHYQQTVDLSRNQLAVLLGNNPFTTAIKTKQPRVHHYFVSLPVSLPANLLANRPDIHAAKLRAGAAANQVNVAKALFFPNINLSALFSYQSVHINNLFSAPNQNNAITGAIDLPLFDAGKRRANLREKYAEYDLAVEEYNKTVLNALYEVANQVTTLRTVNSQLSAQNTSYNAINHNYKLFLMRYNHGIIDYTQVLENKNILLQQKSAQLELQTQHLQTIAALLTALGGKDV